MLSPFPARHHCGDGGNDKQVNNDVQLKSVPVEKKSLKIINETIS